MIITHYVPSLENTELSILYALSCIILFFGPATQLVDLSSQSRALGNENGVLTTGLPGNSLSYVIFLVILWPWCSFFFFNWNIEIYNVVIVSAAQQSESAPCIHDFPLFWISFPFRSQGHWAEFPVLNRRFSLVQFSHSVVSKSLQPHGLQHARLPCPSPTPGAYSNSCPLSQWCHPTISYSVIPFSSFLQSFPASGSFQGVSSSHQVAKVL